jgi:transcriptional regulator with XRE-family HTH domain
MCIILNVSDSPGKRFKQARRKLGLSQLELSELSGISQASIARIEAGRQKNLRVGTIKSLSGALEVSLSGFWDEPKAAREAEADYAGLSMLPVVEWDEVQRSADTFPPSQWRAAGQEPAVAGSGAAFFVVVPAGLAVDNLFGKGDLLLMQEIDLPEEGSLCLVLFRTGDPAFGRLFHHPPLYVLQQTGSEKPPITFRMPKRLSQKPLFFCVAEIRRKLMTAGRPQ